jgi:internalin A
MPLEPFKKEQTKRISLDGLWGNTSHNLRQVERRIREAEETGAKELTLESLNLTRLPNSLGELTQLRSLNVSGNNLTALPESLGQLTQLQSLDVSGNNLTALPESLGQLTQLQSLDVSGNRSIALPEFLGHLTQLQTLAVCSNNLTALPEFLGQLTRLQGFYVYHNQLTTLPEWLGQLIRLQRLYLTHNQLTALPESLGQLTQLQHLEGGGNFLTALPESLGQLTQLQSLNLADNQLTALPESLGQLTQLQYLDLTHNQLTALPESLGPLTQLQCLNVTHNQLTALPESLGQLTQLQCLYVTRNRLAALPESIGQLTQLQHLEGGGNFLTALPVSLGQLTQLQSLDVSFNKFAALPESLRRLSSLKELFLHGNQALNIPKEVLGPGYSEVHGLLGRRDEDGKDSPASPAFILDYYFRTRRGRRPLNEAKLILVGRGGVGKTCLIQRLLHDTFDASEPETPGIHIQPWPVKLPCGDDVRLHVWDFGGQRILHGTHQFFLTERTLYLLVLSGREDSATPDAEYWLQLIRSFGGESRVIIALNKQHEHPFDVNRGLLLEKYPFIADFVGTDCEDGFGLLDLKELIYGQTDGMEHRKTDFPADWFFIKERLASMSESFINWEDYQTICRDLGEIDAQAQRDLAKFLHILGIALNYSDDPRLDDTRVLKPTWVTDGIYTVLRALQKETTGGVLNPADLPRVLDAAAYPPAKHDFLLRLMEKFQLCFRLQGREERYLVPELLGENQPDLKALLEMAGLGFRYQYEVVPEGLLPRFIVQTHVHSDGHHDWRWRTGVVLELYGCRAVVRADVRERRVNIYITGSAAQRRGLLAIIRERFDEQHRELKGLVVEERVPVPGQTNEKGEEVTVSYRDLLLREEDGEEEYRPEGAKEKVRVSDLLNGVEAEESRIRLRTLLKEARSSQKLTQEERILQKIEHHHYYEPGARPEFPGVAMENIGRDKITITNSTLTNCFNTIHQMPEGNVKPELEKLAKLVENLMKKAPPEVAEKAKENLEALVKQATKPKPDRRWFDVSAEGLKEAAQAVAGMGTPIIEVLDKLRGYLGL